MASSLAISLVLSPWHTTDLTFTNHDTGVPGIATTALADSGFEGGIYTAYTADFAIDVDDLRSWRPEVPDGNNVIAIQLTVFNAEADPAPRETGTTLPLTNEPGELTFLVSHFTSDDDRRTAEGIGDTSDGALTVTGVGDSSCFEIGDHDPDKEVSGAVEARVFEQH